MQLWYSDIVIQSSIWALYRITHSLAQIPTVIIQRYSTLATYELCRVGEGLSNGCVASATLVPNDLIH